MRIEPDIKLDYKDVLIRPKRSTLRSRKHVDLSRSYKFRNSHNEWIGIPIIAANMDGVGELSIAEKLNEPGNVMPEAKDKYEKSDNSEDERKEIIPKEESGSNEK